MVHQVGLQPVLGDFGCVLGCKATKSTVRVRPKDLSCVNFGQEWNLPLGLGTEFLLKKFRGIDSEWFPLFRGRKPSFRGIPSSAEELIPKLGTERNGMEFRGKK
jgi:hypothetical protein